MGKNLRLVKRFYMDGQLNGAKKCFFILGGSVKLLWGNTKIVLGLRWTKDRNNYFFWSNWANLIQLLLRLNFRLFFLDIFCAYLNFYQSKSIQSKNEIGLIIFFLNPISS